MCLRALIAIALIAGAPALSAGATAPVKITGKKTLLSNQSTYHGAIDDLPPPPKTATAPAAGSKDNGPMQLSNINGNLQIADLTSVALDANSPRAQRRALRPNLKAQARK